MATSSIRLLKPVYLTGHCTELCLILSIIWMCLNALQLRGPSEEAGYRILEQIILRFMRKWFPLLALGPCSISSATSVCRSLILIFSHSDLLVTILSGNKLQWWATYCQICPIQSKQVNLNSSWWLLPAMLPHNQWCQHPSSQCSLWSCSRGKRTGTWS